MLICMMPREKLLDKFKPVFAENVEWVKQLQSKNNDDQIEASEALQLKQVELLKRKRDKTIEEKEKKN